MQTAIYRHGQNRYVAGHGTLLLQRGWQNDPSVSDKLAYEHMIVEFQPRKLEGPWDGGYALDLHTISSRFLGYDGAGHAQYDTTYTPVGNLLYRLKSGNDVKSVVPLVDAVEAFWKLAPRPTIDLLVPVPPSKQRKQQPVMLVATAISERLGVPLCTTCITKVKQTTELKDVHVYGERMEVLKSAFTVALEQTEGRDILLFDDLFRSGATVGAITEVLKKQGRAKAVRLLTLTRTRSNA